MEHSIINTSGNGNTHNHTHTRYPLLFCIHYRGGEMFIYNLLFIWTFRPWSVVCLNYFFFVNWNFITGDLFCFLCTLIKYTCSERQQYKLTCVLYHISVDHLYSNIPLLEVRNLHFKKKSSCSWEKNNILEFTELFVINSVISCWCFWFKKEKEKQLVCLSSCCELLQQIISVSWEQSQCTVSVLIMCESVLKMLISPQIEPPDETYHQV